MATDLNSLYPLIGASRAEWEAFLKSARTDRSDRKRKMDLLQKWHASLVQTATEIEWVFGSLVVLTEQEDAVAQSKDRIKRRAKAKTKLRDFLMLPADAENKNLRSLNLCSKSGAEMRLECLSFEGSDDGAVVSLNKARELFQAGLTPQAMFGLYYIRNGERSAGHGWSKPFLDEVFVLMK